MRKTTHSPLALVGTALEVAQRSLPLYSHPKSPHKYTQHQLFACLVLKEFLKSGYRDLVQVVSEWSDMRQMLGLTEVPHYSTLCYAQERLLKKGALASCWTQCSNWPESGAC
jgi:hypothetical protein